MKCTICGKEIKGYGNSAYPVTEGKCCEDCNMKVVLPVRIFNANINSSEWAMIITPEEVKLVKPNDKYFTLKDLQEIVEGYIEVVASKYAGMLEVVNEEGLLKGLKPNKLAHHILGKNYVGNVLLTPIAIFEKPEED